MTKDSITLYFRAGGSDKIYQASVEQSNGEFCVVNYAYGRRGSTLQTGTKTTSPVPYARAKQIFDTLVKSKTSKGYTPGADGTPYQHTDKESRSTGILPQLCNAVDADEVQALIADKNYSMQEKFDGKRILLRKDHSSVVGINRKGLSVGVPSPILKNALDIPGEFILDGECVGDVYHAFDLLLLNAEELNAWPCRQRHVALLNLLTSAQTPYIELVDTAVVQSAKSKLFLKLKRANKEGVVFKHQDTTYTIGRPASGGAWLKHKFTTTGSFIVSTINDHRSVGLEVCDGKDRVQVGNVAIPANCEVPTLGGIIEVRYLYAFKGGSVYQPVFLHVRDDLNAQDCTLSQLKFKADDTDEES